MGEKGIKLMSILCAIVVVATVFSVAVTNVSACGGGGGEEDIESLNPDVAVNGEGIVHVVWQENLTGNYEMYYANNLTGAYKTELSVAVQKVQSLISNASDKKLKSELEKVLKELNKALANATANDYQHSFKHLQHAVERLDKKDLNCGEITTALVNSARDITKVNILYREFLNISQDHTTKAWEKFYKGLEKLNEEKYDKAVNEFRKAFKEAYKIDDDCEDEECSKKTNGGIDFGEIVRISYTDYDSVNPQIFLNGTINVGWIELLPSGNHTYYARSNNGLAWWYFDATQHASTYLCYAGIDPTLLSIENTLTITRTLERVWIVDGCHYLYAPIIRDGFTIEDRRVYAPINDPYLTLYDGRYESIHIGDKKFYIICGGPIPSPPPKATDLQIPSISINTTHINVFIRNDGDTNVSGSICVRFYENNQTNDIILSSLNATEGVRLEKARYVLGEGYLIRVKIDPENTLPEGDRTNNEKINYHDSSDHHVSGTGSPGYWWDNLFTGGGMYTVSFEIDSAEADWYYLTFDSHPHNSWHDPEHRYAFQTRVWGPGTFTVTTSILPFDTYDVCISTYGGTVAPGADFTIRDFRVYTALNYYDYTPHHVSGTGSPGYWWDNLFTGGGMYTVSFEIDSAEADWYYLTFDSHPHNSWHDPEHRYAFQTRVWGPGTFTVTTSILPFDTYDVCISTYGGTVAPGADFTIRDFRVCTAINYYDFTDYYCSGTYWPGHWWYNVITGAGMYTITFEVSGPEDWYYLTVDSHPQSQPYVFQEKVWGPGTFTITTSILPYDTYDVCISGDGNGIDFTILDFRVSTDTDGDGLPDIWEARYGLNPNDATDANQDKDGDGLTNLQEYTYSTNPTKADTDGDGLNDGDEVSFSTDPNNPDTDSDGLLDGQEISVGKNPLERDVHAFHLVVSFNWNVSDAYMTDFAQGMQLASNYLYDVTDGYMLFSTIEFYDNNQSWNTCNIKVYNSSVWPHVDAIGGICDITDPSDDRYPIELPHHFDGSGFPWNYSWTNSNAYRTIIHEFGHYALYLYDEYLNSSGGQIPYNQLMHTVMAYQYNYSELSTPNNYSNPLPGTNTDTYHWAQYNQSCWETVFDFYRTLIEFDLDGDGVTDTTFPLNYTVRSGPFDDVGQYMILQVHNT